MLSTIFDSSKVSPIGSLKMVDGKPMLVFSDLEMNLLMDHLKFAMVGKFSHAMPPARVIALVLNSLKLEGNFSWSFLNPHHILLKLSSEKDYSRLWICIILMIRVVL